jgi:hypothetical protein
MLDRELLKREESPISAIPGSPRLGIRRPRSGSDANLSPSPSPYLRRRAATPSMCCSLVCTFVLVLIVLSLSLCVYARSCVNSLSDPNRLSLNAAELNRLRRSTDTVDISSAIGTPNTTARHLSLREEVWQHLDGSINDRAGL